MFCPSAGTYYLKVVLDRKYNVADAKSFTLVSVFASNASRKLTQGKIVYSYADYENKDIMYQIQVKKTGVIGFYAFANDTSSLLGGNVTLYNAKKKAVSAEEYVSNSSDTSSNIKYLRAYYAVKKGTYYVKFSKTTSSLDYYFAGCSFKAVKDSSGSSKAKAAAIKIGAKAKKGEVLVSDSAKKTDWYKITLKKSMAFTIDVTSYVSGKLKMEICDSKGRTALFGTRTLTGAQHNKISTSAKWSKGTYYIKIFKSNAKSCGYYELKIKK
jgi:hypothetical protein